MANWLTLHIRRNGMSVLYVFAGVAQSVEQLFRKQ